MSDRHAGKTDERSSDVAQSDESWRRLFVPKYQGAQLTDVKLKAWSGISASVKELHLDGPFHADLQHDCARLTVMLGVIGDIPDARCAPSRPTPIIQHTLHQMNYAPANMPVWAHSEHTQFLRHISFTISAELLNSPIDEDDLLESFSRPRFMFFDEPILHLANLFHFECVANTPTDLLYGDSLAVALLTRLAKLEGRGIYAPKSGALSAQQFRRVTTYMLDRLAAQISLAELAGVLEMSRSSFCRAFRISTGVSAHRWLLLRRCDRAEEYLRATALPLAEIAQLTGFADQAHFSRMFRRFEGVSPAAWRRLRRD